MTYATKVILHAPAWDSPKLVDFVADCLRCGVRLICVVGPDAERVHDVIDGLIVGGGGSAEPPLVVTTWHENEGLPEVREFADDFSGEGWPEGPAQVVSL